MTEGKSVKTILKEENFIFKKKFGQNFITDPGLINKIVKAGDVKPGDVVVEIGPGAGTLTKGLLEASCRVLAVEIDKDLIPILRRTLVGFDNIKIVNQDVMKVDLDQLVKENFGYDGAYKVVANLPYYITTPIIMKLLEHKHNIERITIMVQKEVAERLVSTAGTKDYGAITLAVNYYSKPQIAFKVPRQAFIPQPEVDSAVITLDVYDKPPVACDNPKLLFKLIKAAFQQRRKTLNNALSSLELKKEKVGEILNVASIDGQRRGETLSLEDFAMLANVWNQNS